MKRLLLLTLMLGTLVFLSNLPVARAAVGDCHIRCCDGRYWLEPGVSGSTCCNLFGSRCGYYGIAYQESSSGNLYCFSIDTCGLS